MVVRKKEGKEKPILKGIENTCCLRCKQFNFLRTPSVKLVDADYGHTIWLFHVYIVLYSLQ